MASSDIQDYYEIYKNVNQITRAVPTTQCSEVMSVTSRMYFKLDMLQVELLSNPESVKELVVFADVVEIEGEKVEIPASRKITIVCRILQVKEAATELGFKFFGPVECERGWLPGGPMDAALILSSSPQVELSIYAQKAVCTSARQLTLRIAHPVTVLRQTSPHSNRREAMPGTMEWRITTSNAADLSAAQLSCELRTERYWSIAATTWRIDQQEWSQFTTLLPGSAGPTTANIPLRVLGDPNVVLGMQSTLLKSELIVSFQTNAPQTVSAAVEHVEWLNTNLLQLLDDNSSSQAVSTDTRQELLTLLARAESILKLPHDGSQHLIVPRLEYGQYSDLISNMAAVAELYNNEFRQLDLFIQQNEILGSYLLEQNKAFAQRERDMEVFQGLLVARKQEELRTADERMQELNVHLTQQREAMDQAQKDMEEGLKRYRDEQVAKAFFVVMKAVIEVAAAIFTGGATAGLAVKGAVQAVNAVSKLAGMLDMVLNILEGMEKVMEVLNAINDLTQSLAAINELVEMPKMPTLPSTMEWDIFENEIEEVAESMPEEVTEARTWRTKCRNVAAVCREISTTATYIGQLQYDLFVHSAQGEIARRHAERLERMQPADLTNYLEMATQLDMRTTRMLLGLLNLLPLQSGALQFHYLLPPSPFTGWVTMDMVRNALVQHAADALAARERLGPSTDFTRTYVVSEVPLSLLLDGDDYIFTIRTDDNSTFPLNWSRVRIQYVEIKLTGSHKPTTNSGQLYILLQASRIFQDRLLDDVLQFQAAVPLQYQYAYDLESGETTLSNRPAHQHQGEYMQMTPFGQWRLRLSASASENQGLAFATAVDLDSSTTEIAITFYLTAIRRISTRMHN